MENILETGNPIITTVPMIADLFTMLHTEVFNSGWICNNFNQLVYIRDPRKIEFENVAAMYEQFPKENNVIYCELPFVKFNKIKKDIFKSLGLKIIDFVINSIDKGYYIRIPLNMKILHNLNDNFFHTCMIYGYNKNKSLIYVSEFKGGNKYNVYEYSFSDIEKSFNNSFIEVSLQTEYLEDILLVKPDKNIYSKIEANIFQLCSGIGDYLKSVDTPKKYEYSERWKGYSFYFGQSIFDEMIKDIKNNDCATRSIHALHDFTMINKEKIVYLFEKNLIKPNVSEKEKIIECFGAAIKSSLIARNLLIKNNSVQSELVNDKITNHLLAVKNNINTSYERILDLADVTLSP